MESITLAHELASSLTHEVENHVETALTDVISHTLEPAPSLMSTPTPTPTPVHSLGDGVGVENSPTTNGETPVVLGDSSATHWTKQNTNTVEKWLTMCRQSHFVCKLVRDHYKTRVKMFTILMMIITSLATALGFYSSSASSLPTNMALVSVLININTGLTTLGGIISSCIGVLGWNDIVLELTSYAKDYDYFESIVTNQLMLAKHLREDANVFITMQSPKFLKLMNDPNSLSERDKEWALKKWRTISQDTLSALV